MSGEIEVKNVCADGDDRMAGRWPELNVFVGDGEFPEFFARVAIDADDGWFASVGIGKDDLVGGDEGSSEFWGDWRAKGPCAVGERQ